MNTNILQGNWKLVRGDLQSWWGRLTSDDIERIHGNVNKLAGILQERYGYSMREAQLEIADFMDRIEFQFEDHFDIHRNR